MRVPFDKYDTAILLEAYLQVEDGTLTRRQAAEHAAPAGAEGSAFRQ